MGITAAILVAGSAATSALGSIGQGNAAMARGKYISSVDEQNAKLADLQSEDAIARGYETELKRRTQTKELVGSQRAAMAAQGIDVGSGSAADVIDNATAIGEADALTIRNNAKREAWGFKVEALGYRQQGRLALLEGRNARREGYSRAFNTLLSGGAQTYSAYKRG